ncbi:MAG: cytochrome [Planctomycetaceae bacterium]|nr:cytochrome [Planctomycetaceae bacterium]
MKLTVLLLIVIGVMSCWAGWLDQTTDFSINTMSATHSRGESAVVKYGCGACHTIPGIRGADGLVGPPLDKIASRTYIAGVLRNSPENLRQWIRNPQAVDPLTAMPNLQIPESDINDLVAFLQTLQ